VFSTTRRAIGLIGLTGSLVASSQISSIVTNQSDHIYHQTKPFSISLSTKFGAFSNEDTPLPLVSTFTSFKIGSKKCAKKVEKAKSVTIQDETASPHPLEIADASADKTKETTSPFVLSIITVQKGDSLNKIAHRYKINESLLKNINSKPKSSTKKNKKGKWTKKNNAKNDDTFTKKQQITIYKGNFKKHKVKKGESIWSIAQKYNTKMSVLIFLNKMKAIKIYPGKNIYIPEMINEQSTNLASSVNWVKRLIEPPYQTLIGGKGRITSPFGWRTHPVTSKKGFHVGIDIGARKSTPIKAWKSGVVHRACKIGLMGNCVIIRHKDGFSSIYGHCSVLSVKAGEKVNAGQKIAEVGMTGRATGSHVHFAIKKNGRFLNPTKHL